MASTDDIDPASFNHKFFQATCANIKLHYVDQGEGTDKVVVFLHGFPELWYSWRKQIRALEKAGYRVIVPDLPGYGQTVSDDNDLTLTCMKTVCACINELLKSLGITKFTVIGHDWGGALAWTYAVYHPDLLKAVGSVCTPYLPRPEKFTTMDQMLKLFPQFAYQVYFGSEEAVKEMDANVEKLFYVFFRKSDDKTLDTSLFMKDGAIGAYKDVKPSDMLTAKEMQYYIDQYKARGFRGGLNWYRTRKQNWEQGAGFDPKINIPGLMLTAGRDYILTPAMTAGMEKVVPNLTRANIENAGHWVLSEQADQVSKIFIDWLQKVYA